MNPSKYIQEQLDNLKKFERVVVPKEQLATEIIKKVLSKKFRKYAVDETFRTHLQKLVDNAIASNSPITFVMPFGGYKLWRIPTHPSVDWAELFSLIYYARYAKSIAEIYDPGVIFDFFSDDVVVSQMDNIPAEDIEEYQKSFKELLRFVSGYLSSNVKLSLNRVADQYGEGEFEKELAANILKLKTDLTGGLPKMDEIRKALVELNVKLAPGQDNDPLWREKVLLIHDAYAMSSKRRPYYRNENRIMVVNVGLPGALALGTTKASVAKFWCGMGVLAKQGESYIEKILSPKQIEVTKMVSEKVEITGLELENFEMIGVVD